MKCGRTFWQVENSKKNVKLYGERGHRAQEGGEVLLCALFTVLENVRMIINNSGVAGMVSCVLLRGDIWRGNQS